MAHLYSSAVNQILKFLWDLDLLTANVSLLIPVKFSLPLLHEKYIRLNWMYLCKIVGFGCIYLEK